MCHGKGGWWQGRSATTLKSRNFDASVSSTEAADEQTGNRWPRTCRGPGAMGKSFPGFGQPRRGIAETEAQAMSSVGERTTAEFCRRVASRNADRSEKGLRREGMIDGMTTFTIPFHRRQITFGSRAASGRYRTLPRVQRDWWRIIVQSVPGNSGATDGCAVRSVLSR